MSTTQTTPLPYPRDLKEIPNLHQSPIKSQPPVRWSEAWARELEESLNGIETQGELLSIRTILQFKYCEMHRRGKITFNQLCVAMVLLEDLFKDVINMGKDCIFTRYLSIAFAKGGNVAGATWRAVNAIYSNMFITAEMLTTGIHQEVLRRLFIWAANEVKNKPTVSDRRESAADVVLLLLDSTEKRPNPWDMDGITEKEAFSIASTLR